jgi:hypothetical protein
MGVIRTKDSSSKRLVKLGKNTIATRRRKADSTQSRAEERRDIGERFRSENSMFSTSLQITASHDLIICTDKTKAILSEKLLAHHFEHCWIGDVSDVLKGQAVAQIEGNKPGVVNSFPPSTFKGDHMLRHRLGQGLLERLHQLMAFVYILNVGSVSLHPRHGEKTFFYKLMEVIFAGESFFEALPIPCKKAT